jgi:hypothetical protein
MSNTIFIKWTDAVRHLNEKIKNKNLIAGQNIQLEDTGHGIRINSVSENTGGDSYNGYFKVIQSAADKIKIVDGFDEEAANCYSGLINKLNKYIPATEVTITQSGVVYLEVVPVYTDDVVSNWTCTFKHTSSMPYYEDKKAFIPISRVTFADGKITDFSRENVALPLTVRGNC